MRTFHVRNFGCRATQADGAAIEGDLARHGMSAADAARADLVVLNSCTVTATADQDLHKAVRRVHRENPLAKILVTGCYAQRAPDEIAALPGVEWVVGNSHKTEIAGIVTAYEFHGRIFVGDILAQQAFFSSPIEGPSGDRSRPNLKIQDGCNNRCSFCIIPSVRGRSRSADPDWIVAQVRGLASTYREVVLTGVNLGRWGRERGEGRKLPGLIRRLLDETQIDRLRLSSIEPMDFSDELLELMTASPRIANHVHAPLQSGSDAVLRRMYRKYRPRHYEDRILKARRLMPDAAIGADVMVGFPGETAEEFEESRAFIESLPFTCLHVFTYSERPGTRAAEYAQVPWEERKRRNAVLRDLATRKNLTFRRSLLGTALSVVTMGGREAMSSNFVNVEMATETPPQQIRNVVVRAVAESGVAERQTLPVLQ